ncbi:MAG: DUF5818 domain-containing protein [Terriglobales bacterium]
MQFKKFFAVVPALALSTAMVFAQEPQPTPTQTPQTDVGQPTDTNEPVFKGCLSGTKDNYTLTNSDGKTFRLHSDKDISEHVGKMVEIRGTVKKEGVDRPADAAPASSSSEMDVADVKSIEGSCPFAAASSDMPKAEATNLQASTTVAEPSATAAVSTEAPVAAEAKVETTTEPAATAAVSTDTQATETAPATTEQKVEADSAQLPETASSLPLLGLLGFASMGLGLLARRK